MSLKNHPLIIVVMFILSVLSAVITIVLGWTAFYKTILSQEIRLPVWFLLLILFTFAIIYIFRPQKSRKVQELETIEGAKYGVQRVEIDGKRFVNCEFEGSELIFHGEKSFDLEKNTFKPSPRISFVDYAGTTLMVMKGLHKDPTFRKIIEASFKDSNGNT